MENLPFIIVLVAVVFTPTIVAALVVRSWGRHNARLTEGLRQDLEQSGVITNQTND